MKLKSLLKLKIEDDATFGRTDTEIGIWFPTTHCWYITEGGKFKDYDIEELKRRKVYRKFLNLKIESIGLRHDLPNCIVVFPKHSR